MAPLDYRTRGNTARNNGIELEGESDDIIAYATIIENGVPDRIIDSDEETILVDAATSFGLSHDQVTGVHKSFLDNLIVSALADGVVTNAARLREILVGDPQRMRQRHLPRVSEPLADHVSGELLLQFGLPTGALSA